MLGPATPRQPRSVGDEELVQARHDAVERFDLPGTHSLNFLLHESLGGGGIASVRIDPQGKGFAQMLLDIEIPVPADLAAREGLNASDPG